jgi:hypothetical protein
MTSRQFSAIIRAQAGRAAVPEVEERPPGSVGIGRGGRSPWPRHGSDLNAKIRQAADVIRGRISHEDVFGD